MSMVAIRIVSQTYTIGCEDGQETRLADLARVVDAKAREILNQIGPLSEDTLLATTCIVLADELASRTGGDDVGAVSDADLEQILKRVKQITKKLSQGA